MIGQNASLDAASHSGSTAWPRLVRRAGIAWHRANGFALLEGLAVVALLIAVFGGWMALDRPREQWDLLPGTATTSLLVATLIPAMALLVLMGRRLALRRARRLTGSTGRLHVRLVFFFSLLAAVPTLLVVAFASFLFQSGVQFWFSEQSRGMLENANKLARGYYEQNLRDVGDESVAMAGDLRAYLAQSAITSPEFAEAYSYQVIYRKLNESAIIERGEDGVLRTAAIVDPDEDAEPERIEPNVFERLNAGETVVVNATADRIEAVTPLDGAGRIFLYTARNSDALALSQWERAQSVLASYDELTGRVRSLQLRFNFALLAVSLALVGLAVWFALRFADRQVAPLAELLTAARTVGAGNFSMRVGGRTGTDEIGLLNRAFNRMTEQIERQTLALIGANEQIDERRAFTEAVLDSATAGIVSVDSDGQVLLINGSAQAMLLEGEQHKRPIVGERLAALAPQLARLMEEGRSSGIVQYQRGGDARTLAVKLAETNYGHVLTFEDITRQLLDQRRAAWSDVARRIAHEIKNPLTPIQLATERLGRRYRKQIETDAELFDELTQTIIRQVGDLRKMVDEFSSFARMPKPNFRTDDMADLVRQAIFLQEVANPQIDYSFAGTDADTQVACDRHQVGQAMTNVLKNAAEAIESRQSIAGEDYRGRIAVTLRGDSGGITVSVTDNGIGLPEAGEKVVEPYMTTRDKGTGLGLAIVQKILGEHGGHIAFEQGPDGGTVVRLRFARNPLAETPAEGGMKQVAE